MQEIPEQEESRHPKTMIKQVVMSFYYAFDGLFYVMLTQRNMRFHFCMALWTMSFAVILKLPVIQKSFIFMIITFLFAMEILNTCIENLTNLMSPDYHIAAKIAKDTAAAAVLVVSIGSVMAAGYLLIGPFFAAVLDPRFWRAEHFQIAAVVIIVVSVLGFWLTRALELPMRVSLMAAGSASAFGIAFLGAKNADWLAFVAMLFFSFMLFNSLARRKTPIVYPLAAHVAGLLVFAGWRLLK